MSTQSLPWFRMYVEAVDDEKLRLLSFEDRWHFVALLCCKGQGVIKQDDPLMRRKLAVKLGLDILAFEEAMRRLADVGLIDAKTLEPVAWDDRQMRSDSSAARVAAYRERKRQEASNGVKRDGNVTVTAQDKDKDKEEDKEVTTLSSKPDDGAGNVQTEGKTKICKRVIDHLNLKTGSAYKHVSSNLGLVAARLKDGATEDEMCRVIDRKCAEWLGDAKTSGWLRPKTLFRATNYDNYVGQLNQPLPSQSSGPMHSGFAQQDYSAGVTEDGYF